MKERFHASIAKRYIAVLDLVQHTLEGEQPYRPYSGVLHLHENRYTFASVVFSS